MHRRTIGLLGGSFNPAHDGHLHISREALKRLRLDEVWWLVSPQNPLKSSKDMASYEDRLALAKELARDRRIRVLDVERQWGIRYTVDTVRALKRLYPGARFVWLMGADNLSQFHRWRQWRTIARLVPIAVFDRLPYAYTALRSRAAGALSRFKTRASQASVLPLKSPPAWVFLPIRLHPESASRIRKKLGKEAFLRHNEEVDI